VRAKPEDHAIRSARHPNSSPPNATRRHQDKVSYGEGEAETIFGWSNFYFLIGSAEARSP
jgi:hypothetical protein